MKKYERVVSIGYEFITKKGGTYKVIGDNGLLGNKKRLMCLCSICNKDSELFPEPFKTTSSRIKSELPSCNCSPQYYWSQEQYKILCKRKAIECNATILNFPEHINRTSSKIKVSCNFHKESNYDISVNKFLNGQKGCGRCRYSTISKLRSKPDGHYESILPDLLKDDGIFLRWETESRRCIDNIIWKCNSCNMEITQSVHNIQNGHRCNVCRPRGYNTDNIGGLYVVRWRLNESSFIKFGITNHEDVYKRIHQQQSGTKFSPELIEFKKFDDGSVPRRLENIIKRRFKGKLKVIESSKFSDGYTETIEDSKENLDFILNLIGYNYDQE